MNKSLYKYVYHFISLLMAIVFIMTFHMTKLQAAETTTNEYHAANYKLTKNNSIQTKDTKFNQNNLLDHNNKKQVAKNIVKNNSIYSSSKKAVNQKAQPASQILKSKKLQTITQPIQNHKTLVQSNTITKNNTNTNVKAIKSEKKKKYTLPRQFKQVKTQVQSTKLNKTGQKSSKVTAKKPQVPSTSSKVTKFKKSLVEPSPKHNQTKIQKPQILSATVKNKPSNTQIKKAKASKSVKVTPKSSKKKQTNLNYYNQAPKRWSSKIPGSDNVRDFGQTTSASGINDALKIMKASGNKGVTLEHTNAKAANIATVFNWNPTAKALTYGTGTAIGKHTIITANHVINNQQAHKPMTPSSTQNLRINLLQEGSKVARSLQVTGVKMLQYGDVALVYTNEDISKYMKIRKIAPEKSITNIKSNTPIHLYHYGLPTGKYKKDPMGTMYHSKGKYSLMARNVNPMGYYQMMAEPGSSGGSILNSKNEILGVHAFRIDSGDYKKYHLNTMAELRGKLRQEVIKNIK